MTAPRHEEGESREDLPSDDELVIEPYDEIHCSYVGDYEDLGSERRIITKTFYQLPSLRIFSEWRGAGSREWMSPLIMQEYSWHKGQEFYLAAAKYKTDSHWDLEGLRRYDFPDQTLEEASCLHEFFVNLWSWDYSLGPKKVWWQQLLPTDEIIESSLTVGPPYAKWLDGFKAAVLHTIGDCHTSTDEVVKHYSKVLGRINFQDPAFRAIVSIADIYRANSLFKWNPPHLDWKEVSMESVELTNETISRFRAAIKSYLSRRKLDFLREIPWESLERDNMQTSNDGINLNVPAQPPARVRGVSKIVHIPRELKEARCAVIEDYASALKVRWIEANVTQILRTDKRDAHRYSTKVMGLKLGEYMRQVKKRFTSGSNFKPEEGYAYCRDFHKEGLTKPRELLRVMLEELNLRFPNWSSFWDFDFFDIWTVQDGEETFFPPRGHGLGMANALTTLMQIGIEMMNIRILGYKPTGSLYLNDDACIVFGGEDSARLVRDYRDIDRITCSELGLKFKEKASFISNSVSVICEAYGVRQGLPKLGDKTCFAFMTYATLMNATNASHARALSSSMNAWGLDSVFVNIVQNYFGWVLYKNEHIQPLPLGGWQRDSLEGIDVTFYNKYGDEILSKNQYAAYLAYRQAELIPKPWLKGKSKKPKFWEHVTPEYLEKTGARKIDLAQMERPTTNQRNNHRMWSAYQKSVRKYFSERMSDIDKGYMSIPPISDIYLAEIRERPTADILPPKNMRRDVFAKERGTSKDVTFFHPYASLPREFGNKWSLTSQADYILAAGQHGSLDLKVGGPEVENYAAKRAIELRSIVLGGYSKKPDIWNSYITPPNEVLKYWHNPFGVTKVADAFGSYYSSVIPTAPQSVERLELLSKRDAVYGRALTTEEWMDLGSVRPADKQVVMLLADYVKQHEEHVANSELRVNLNRYLRNYPGIGDFIMDLCGDRCRSTVFEVLEQWIVASESESGLNDEWSDKPEYSDRELVVYKILDRAPIIKANKIDRGYIFDVEDSFDVKGLPGEEIDTPRALPWVVAEEYPEEEGYFEREPASGFLLADFDDFGPPMWDAEDIPNFEDGVIPLES